MKVYKKIIIWMIIISLISLVSGGIIEYKKIGGDNHYQFFENISLGIFASAILSLITAIISYIRERKKFLIIFYQNVKNALYTSLEIIDSMKNKSKKFNSLINKLVEYNDYFVVAIEEECNFLKKDMHIKLLESAISEIGKIQKTLGVILQYREQLEEGKIDGDKYLQILDKFTKEIDEEYTDDLNKNLKVIEEKLKEILPNRILEHNYIDS